MGANNMWWMAEQRFAGIQKIRRVLGDLPIAYDDCGGFECLNNIQVPDIQLFKTKLEWLNEGFEKITGNRKTFEINNNILAQQGIQSFDYLVENRLEGGIHSGFLLQHLSAKVVAMGARVLQGHQMLEYEPDKSGWSIIIDVQKQTTIQLKAQQMLFATNANLSKQFPELAIMPARGQVLLSPSMGNNSLRGTFHFDEGFYYFRNVGNRLLIGGGRNVDFEGEATLELGQSSVVVKALNDFIMQHLPKVAALINEQGWQHWSGIMAITLNKLPLFKVINAGCYAAMACNGMGVALTPIHAEMVAKAIVDHSKNL
jgi:glycine/D-amino acid oxidase-like deaminating enzyme